jgi:hypothetical protein
MGDEGIAGVLSFIGVKVNTSFSLLNVQIHCLSMYYSLRFIFEYKLILLQIQICIISAFVLIFIWSHSHLF